MTVDIFIPCFIDQLYPHTGMNMVKILEKFNVTVHYNENQTCCGQMAFTNGFWNDAKELGEKFIEDFPNNRPIVAPSTSCVSYVRKSYGKLFFNTGLHLEYKRLQKNIIELSDFLVNMLKVEDTGATFAHKVTYHDSCSALREYKLKDEPRKLLKNVAGLELVEMNDTQECCGFGGTFSINHEAISTAMAEQKVQNALDTEAEFIISTDFSCLMQQEAYINKNKKQIKVIHLADVLASGW
jgi:L-lactate dehydrogenase complex protein LldE